LDEVTGAVLRLAGLVDGDDAGVLELGGAAGLAQEAVDLLLARQAARAQDLDGDGAVEFGVAGAEDRAEGADAQLLQQLELAQAPAGAGRPRAAGADGFRSGHEARWRHVRRGGAVRGPAQA